jgi:hypothetical protein
MKLGSRTHVGPQKEFQGFYMPIVISETLFKKKCGENPLFVTIVGLTGSKNFKCGWQRPDAVHAD